MSSENLIEKTNTNPLPSNYLSSIILHHPDYDITMYLIEITPLTKEVFGGVSISANFYIDIMFLKNISFEKRIKFSLSNQKTFQAHNTVTKSYNINNLGMGTEHRFDFKLKITAGSLVDQYFFKDDTDLNRLYYKFEVRGQEIFSGKIESEIGYFPIRATSSRLKVRENDYLSNIKSEAIENIKNSFDSAYNNLEGMFNFKKRAHLKKYLDIFINAIRNSETRRQLEEVEFKAIRFFDNA
jgi:hypothetical protein